MLPSVFVVVVGALSDALAVAVTLLNALGTAGVIALPNALVAGVRRATLPIALVTADTVLSRMHPSSVELQTPSPRYLKRR